MGISLSSLKGYLLEDALSKLVYNSGYTLLTSDIGSDDLHLGSNGLNVIGRGGLHQADVLGQFPFSYPFTYPIRLFIEAKFQKGKTGIDVVRKGIGIIQDLNHNYQTALISDERELLIQRYNYNYSVFSTSGFSSNAINLAIAHKIHLIDLSGEEYKDLLININSTAEELMDIHGGEIPTKNIRDIRSTLRANLFDSYDFIVNSEIKNQESIFEAVNTLASFIKKYSDLYLASTNTPFVVLLKPNYPQLFHELIKYKQSFTARITWERIGEGSDMTTNWYLHPHLNNNLSRSKKYIQEQNLYLSFRIPTLIENIILKSSNEKENLLNARYSKEKYLNRIVFFTRKNGREFFVNIQFDSSQFPDSL